MDIKRPAKPSTVDVLVLVLVLVLVVGFAPTAQAAGKTWWTYPMPAKVKPADPMRINPGVSVPFQPERYTWKVAAPKNEAKITVVPVYDFTAGRLTKIGNVPLGIALTLDEFMAAGKAHYYTLKFTPPGGKETKAWINGNYVAPAGLASDK